MLVTYLSEFESRPVRELADSILDCQAANRLRPVTVVVSSRVAGVFLRRELTRYCDAIGNVTFTTPIGLARDILDRGSQNDFRRVPSVVLSSFLRTSIADALGRQADIGNLQALSQWQPDIDFSTILQFNTAVSELALVEESLIEESLDMGTTFDLVRKVYLSTRKSLRENQFMLEADAILSATKLLRGQSSANAKLELGAVVVYLPHSIVKAAAKLIGELSSSHSVVVIDGLTGYEPIDLGSIERIEHLNTEEYPSLDLKSISLDHSYPKVKIVSTPDRRSEVDIVVAGVLDAISLGVPLESICVYYTNEQKYLPQFLDTAQRAQIPVEQLRPMESDTNKAFELLKAAYAFYLSGARVDLMDLFSKGAVFYQGRKLDTGKIENFTIEWELTGNLFDFSKQYLEKQRSTASLNLVQRELVNDLVGFLLDFEVKAQIFDRSTQTGAWSDIADACVDFFNACLTPIQDEFDLIGEEANGLPVGYFQLLAAFSSLRQLDNYKEKASPSAFWNLIQLEIALRPNNSTSSRGIRVASIFSFNAIPARRGFVLGLSDDMFFQATGSRLLPESIRRSWGLLTTSQRNALDMRAFLLQFQLCDDVVLCVPRSDISKAGALFPAPIIATLETLYQNLGKEIAKEQVLSRKEFLASNSNPIDLRSLKARNLAFSSSNNPTYSFSTGVATEVLGAKEVDLLDVGANKAPISISGKLRNSPALNAALATLSPTGIEQWLSCPYEFLLRNIFRLNPYQAPEDVLRLDALTRGTLLHAIFEHLIEEKGTDIWNPQELNAKVDEIVEINWQKIVESKPSRSKAKRFWLASDRRKILREVKKFAETDNLVCPQVLDNVLEKAIEGEIELPDLERYELFDLEDQSLVVRLKGKIDRVMVKHDGVRQVVDYKTGKNASYFNAGALVSRKVQVTLYQMLIDTASKKTDEMPGANTLGSYWFISELGGYRIYDLSDIDSSRVKIAVAGAVLAMRRGIFFAGLHEISNFSRCQYCDPDQSGTNYVRNKLSYALGGQIPNFADDLGDSEAWPPIFALARNL